MTDPAENPPARMTVGRDMAISYQRGASIRAIAADWGRSYCYVRIRLLEADVVLRGRGGYQPRRSQS